MEPAERIATLGNFSLGKLVSLAQLFSRATCLPGNLSRWELLSRASSLAGATSLPGNCSPGQLLSPGQLVSLTQLLSDAMPDAGIVIRFFAGNGVRANSGMVVSTDSRG